MQVNPSKLSRPPMGTFASQEWLRMTTASSNSSHAWIY
jgi:hypothetical protein